MVTGESSDSAIPPSPRRIIKRYSNRKLYDTKGSSYVTLLQIAEMIREGEDVQIIDNATKEDKTDVTLALIISEELRTKPRGIPLTTLKALIRNKGERILTQLREGPIGKLMPIKEGGEGDPLAGMPSSIPPPPREEDDLSQSKEAKEGKGLRATLEQWQSTIDERIRAVLPNFAAFRDLEQAVKRLSERVESLERNLEKPGEKRE
ncbi:MAG TPA: polyhydroxyalkanoate synthesis regulator DNA-binding domain-containing protein [Polyangiaceae bacterium]|jgi:polyhydroxyalkanoate synthesis repressor PhaR|nr:polyhydroxyalkanoate synthesis regulator DNA-binding domain-containing protein [Polyangiaceae bacterium]